MADERTYLLAGASNKGDFPPGLRTATPATELRTDETPDGYGFDLDADGRIRTGSVPTGTARIQKSVTIGANTYLWHYNRLWRINGTTLEYGARFYEDVYVPQRNGDLFLNEDANAIVAVVPVMPDELLVVKSTGGYTVGNIGDTRALFQVSDIIQELRAAAAARVTELGNVAYVSNTHLFAYRNGQVEQITDRVRDSVSAFSNQSLTLDLNNQRIIGGTAFVYDVPRDKLFKFSGTTFRYTTPKWHLPDYAPAGIERVMLVNEHGTAASGYLEYQVRYDDDDWQRSQRVNIRSTEERYTTVAENLASITSSRTFQLRITSLSSNKYIKAIYLQANPHGWDGYSR